MPVGTTVELTGLVARKHECLTQLREFGSRQLELIAAGELGQLIRILSAKQRLLAILADIERQLDPYRDQSPVDRQWASVADRDDCARMTAECARLLVEVVEQEKQSEADLIRCRDDASRQLADANSAMRAQNAYGTQESFVYSQLDLSSEHRSA
jgi:hypothetical protein